MWETDLLMTATSVARNSAKVAIAAALEKIATEVIALDVSEHFALADIFVIASGNNEPQVNAIIDEMERKLLEIGEKAIRREGAREGRWVLLDYGDMIIHVMHFEERAYYDLERLWKDCPRITFDELTASSGA